jgi:hypothetical protein
MKRKWFLLLMILILAVAVIGVARVSAAGGYDLSWWAVAGGGVTSSAGGNYSLGGSIGQPAAGTSACGAYHLISGFWAVTQQFYRLFLPLIIH